MHTTASPVLILLVQVGLILGVSRVMGMLFKRVGQPQVMGEMVAGILLGPSLLGWLAPGAFEWVFPSGSRSLLSVLSQLGVIFFLFLLGLDFDLNLMRRQGRSALAISVSSIVVPFLMGMGLAVYLYPRVFDDPGREHYLASVLFMGSAMALTAFPVMARILTERNLQKTTVGILSITSAAVNDVLAWCMLAFVVAIAQYAGPSSGAWTAVLAVAFVAGLFVVVRPMLRRLEVYFTAHGHLTSNLMALIFLLLLACAYAAERIGIHALFGAFVFGMILPKERRFVGHLTEKLEDFTVVFLLPLFFAYAGLRLDLTQLQGGGLIGYTGLVVAVACVGKFGGAALAGRATGVPWRESAAIGVLMNARGLIELVILTIGLELGVINQTVYAMMVIMALVTTAMTTPLLYMVYPRKLFEREQAAAKRFDRWSVMIPVALPRSGPALLQVARLLDGVAGAAAGQPNSSGIAAIHLRRVVDADAYRAALDEPSAPPWEDAALAPLLKEAKEAALDVEPAAYVTSDYAEGIVAAAAERKAMLILMGFHKPVIGQAMLGGTVHRVLTEAPADVAVFVDRGFRGAHHVLVPYLGGRHDRFAMELAARMVRHEGVEVTVLHVVQPGPGQSQTHEARQAMEQSFVEPGAQGGPERPAPGRVTMRVVESASKVDAVLREAPRYDLVIIGVEEEWGLESHLFGFRPERIARDCPTSLLIVRKGTG